MKHIAVIGGTGHLGSRVVTALKRLPNVTVETASRHGQRRLDVTRPETFTALTGVDLVIDLSDATSTRPDAVIAWCLDHGLTVIEATSDAPCVERLFHQHAGRTTGRLVLEGGIFTGVSNQLARHVTSKVGRAESVTLGIASSPLSGAGTGTVELMVCSMGVPSVRYENGVRHDTAGIERGPSMEFGAVTRPTIRASLAEPFMVHQSAKVPTVDVFFAPKPGVLAVSFRMLPTWLLGLRVFRAFMRAYFTALRRVVLRRVTTSVQLVASAKGTAGQARALVESSDGMMAGAWALAAMTEQILSDSSWSGVRFIDDVSQLKPTVERANALAQTTVLQLT